MPTQINFPLSPCDRETFRKLIESAQFSSQNIRNHALSVLDRKTDDDLQSLPDSISIDSGLFVSFLDALRVARYCIEGKRSFSFMTTERVVVDDIECLWCLSTYCNNFIITLRPVEKQEEVAIVP